MRFLNQAALLDFLKRWGLIVVYIFSIVPMVMLVVYYFNFSVFLVTLVSSLLFAIWIDCMELDY